MKKLLLSAITVFISTTTLVAQTNTPNADELNATQQNLNLPATKVQPPQTNKSPMQVTGAFAGCDSITTTYSGGNGLMGAMFDVVADSSLIINGMYTHLSVDSGIFEIYYKTGTMAGYELNAAAWTLVGSANVVNAGPNLPSFVPIPLSIAMNAGDTIGLYISNTPLTGFAGLKYSNGVGAGTLYIDNGALKIFEGNGMTYPFDAIYANRIWNGTLNYCTTITSINDHSLSSISVSPNPVTDKTLFDFGDIKVNSLIITSVDGKKVVEEKNINSSAYTFDRKNLNNGIYFYKVFSGNKLITNGKLLLN